MTQQEQLLAGILRTSARALAGYAAGETPPAAGATESEASAQFDGWQNILTARLEELAVAVSAGRPECFVEQVRWTRTALEARGVPPHLLRAKLEALRRVLVEQIPAELAPPAMACIDCALAEFGGEPAGLTQRLMAKTPEERLAAKYLVAILEGDRREASRLILEAADEGRSVSDLYLSVLQPAQEELGRMWLLGEINVAEEHFATATTRLIMAQLHGREACRTAHGKTLVAAAVAGNQHDLGIQMVADMFETAGWRVIQLGANVPAEDLAQAVEFYQADLVAIAISLAAQWPALGDAISAVRASQRGTAVKILVGGCAVAGIAELAKSRGADGFAANALEAVAQGNALVGLYSLKEYECY
jgi:MerR family transcriptional regulator, light-induced transcriptional regulator